MLRRLMLVLALLVIGVRSGFAQAWGPPLIQVPAWTPQTGAVVRTPVSGAMCVGDYTSVVGNLGLQYGGPYGEGVVTFRWYTDAAASIEITNQSIPITSLIPSQDMIHIPHLGPCVSMEYHPMAGVSLFAAALLNSNAPIIWPETSGDVVLIDEVLVIPPHLSVPIYPADYWAGQTHIDITCDHDGGFIAVYFRDLLLKPWWLSQTDRAPDLIAAHGLPANHTGSIMPVTPMGTWWTVTSNDNDVANTCHISATPQLVPSVKP